MFFEVRGKFLFDIGQKLNVKLFWKLGFMAKNGDGPWIFDANEKIIARMLNKDAKPKLII